MNRARRRGIENEQKGPSCLDRNVKIIGRALSTGLQETMTTEGGRGAVPRMSPQPSIVPLLVVLVPLKDTASQDAVEDKRATLSRARIGLAARIFQESILYLPTLDSSKHPLPLGGRKPSHVADSSVIGEKSRPICWRDVLNDPWNCFYQSVRILTIFTAISPSFFPT